MSFISRAQHFLQLPAKEILDFNPPLMDLLIEKIKKNTTEHQISQSRFTTEVMNFRYDIYSQKAPYLLTERHHQTVNEAELDARSFHFIGHSNGKMKSCLRLTPFPFEINALFPELSNKFRNDFGNYIELSRLISRDRNQTLFLFMQAAVFAQKNGFDGFISICSPENYRRFKKFGLMACSELLTIQYRNNKKYYIISANFTRLNSLGLIFYYQKKFTGQVI